MLGRLRYAYIPVDGPPILPMLGKSSAYMPALGYPSTSTLLKPAVFLLGADVILPAISELSWLGGSSTE